MVEWSHGEVLRRVHNQEALWNFCRPLQVHNNASGQNRTWVNTVSQIGDRCKGISHGLLLLLSCREAKLTLDSRRYRPCQIDILLGFGSRTILNLVARLDDKVNDRSCLCIGIQLWVNRMSRVIVAHWLTISLQVLVNCRPIEEQIGVGFLHLAFRLSVSP